MRKCTIILTPDAESMADIETGAVTTLEILDALKTLSSFFAKQLCKEYTELTGKDPDDPDFESWVMFLRNNKL